MSSAATLGLHTVQADFLADSPAVLHVGGFVHADGQLDLQLGVLTVLGDDHPVELGLLWSVGGRVQDHLGGDSVKKPTNKTNCQSSVL